MISTLVVIGLVILSATAAISFLAGTSYNDYNRDQSYRRLAEQRRVLNAMYQQISAQSDTGFGMTATGRENTRMPPLATLSPHPRTHVLWR